MSHKVKHLLTNVLMILIACSVPPAWAQSTPHVTPLMLQQWSLGQQLGRYGLAQSDPHALLAAARLQRLSGLQPSRARLVADNIDADEQTDAASLLLQAQALAKEQPALLALIEESMTVRRRRGTVIGPQVRPMLVRALKTSPILLSYKQGQRAFFGIASDRIQDIVFSVLGSKNETLCEPAPAGGELLCEWVSGEASDVQVVLTNRSTNAVMLTFFHD